VLGGAAVLTAAIATGGVVVMSSGKHVTSAAQEPPPNTMKVERRGLSAMVSLSGTLTYRAAPDGSPYSVINQASGTYTELPVPGQVISQGQVLYRVNDSPVGLLYGTTPVYRSLSAGASGADVVELNADLVALGLPGGRGESHPPAPTDPDVSLSTHPARATRPAASRRRPWRISAGPPKSWLPHQTARVAQPLRSSPVTGPSSLLRAGPPLCSATGTLPLAIVAAWSSPSDGQPRPSLRNDRFPSSAWTPEPGSRHLYAGHRLGSRQVAPRLIPG